MKNLLIPKTSLINREQNLTENNLIETSYNSLSKNAYLLYLLLCNASIVICSIK